MSLRDDGLAKDAERLHFLIHKVAWTTGSELLGELGQEITKLHRDGGGPSDGGAGLARFPPMNRKANKPDGVNPAIAPWFQVEHHWRGVTDPEHSIAGSSSL